MFTGMVEELGSLQSISKGAHSARLKIAAGQVLEGLKIGDSIAVNGVCLTVVAFDRTGFAADVMAETLLKSGLGSLRPGEKVNLERALRLGDRLGGHLVSGHIDGMGLIRRQSTVDIAMITEISADDQLLRFILDKGSIAVDGISLTVVEVLPDSFTVSLIPHTAAQTTLGIKRVGDRVNLETDLIGKYIARLMPGEKNKGDGTEAGISLGFLVENGFI